MEKYTITAIEPQKTSKKRYNLFLDGEFYCGITDQTVVFAGLKVGKTITSQELENILNSMEVQIAFDKTLNLLSHSMKTEKQIKDYLIQKQFANSVINTVVQKLKSYAYIDDVRYAKTYIEQNKKNKGAFRIKQELFLKGITDEIIQEVLQDINQDEAFDNALIIAKKFAKGETLDEKTKAKISRHLLSRGFSFGVVNSVLSELKANVNDDFKYLD